MKFKVPSKVLYQYASAVSKVINSKNALMILNNFLFKIEGETLIITGSDTDNALTGRIPVSDVEGEGQFCLDARRLVDLLKELPDQGLTITIDDETRAVEISYDSGVYQMVATDASQYPTYQNDDDTDTPMTFSAPASQIINGIDNTLFAVGTDDFHPQMTGILWDVMPDKIVFVSTDTRKMVRYIDATSAPGVTTRAIVPVKASTVIKNVFSRDAMLTITMTQKSATISSDSFTFNCRFIKGNFPPYDRVIPQNNPYVLRVDRSRFLNAVRRVGVFVDPGYGMEKFKIVNDRIYLKSSDPNMCTSGNEELDCEYQGPEIVIGFSAPFVVEICSTLSTEEITLHLSDPSRAAIFRPSENEPNTDLLMLLMPMNVAEF